MSNSKSEKSIFFGFLGIEVLIIVSFLGVLVSSGYSFYQNYATKRTSNEAVNSMFSHKITVMECYKKENSLNGCNSGTNNIQNSVDSKGVLEYLNSFQVKNGVIKITVDVKDTNKKNIDVVFLPIIENGEIEWDMQCSDFINGISYIDECKKNIN